MTFGAVELSSPLAKTTFVELRALKLRPTENGLRESRNFHAAGEFAHFLGHQLLRLLECLVDGRDHQVFQHFGILRIYDFPA